MISFGRPVGGMILHMPISSSSSVSSIRAMKPLKSENSSIVGLNMGHVVFDIVQIILISDLEQS